MKVEVVDDGVDENPALFPSPAGSASCEAADSGVRPPATMDRPTDSPDALRNANPAARVRTYGSSAASVAASSELGTSELIPSAPAASSSFRINSESLPKAIEADADDRRAPPRPSSSSGSSSVDDERSRGVETPAAVATAASKAALDGGGFSAARSPSSSATTSASWTPPETAVTPSSLRNGRTEGSKSAKVSARPRKRAAAAKNRRAEARTADAGWHSAGAALRAAATTLRLRSTDPTRSFGDALIAPSLVSSFVSSFVSFSLLLKASPFVAPCASCSSGGAPPTISARHFSAHATTSSEESERHRSTHGSKNASHGADPTNLPTRAMCRKNDARSGHARSLRQVISSGTKKSFESARPKKRASSSAPERSAARVAGPTPCAPGTVSILPTAVRCGEGTEGAVAEGGAEDGIEARAKNVGRDDAGIAPRVDAPFPPATWTPATCPPPIGASPAPSPTDAFPLTWMPTWPPPIGASL